MRLTQIVEALLFASDAPLTAADIARIDERLDEDTVDAVIQELRAEYDEAERAFQIYEVAGGYQLLTRPDFATYLERYETIPQPTKLSSSGLEVLAIIAYRQPIGRGEVEEIRGVGSSGSIKTLLDRGLIAVAGRGEGLGRPLLYGTTAKFLEHFGFKSLDDLPRPDDLPVVLRSRPAPLPATATGTAEPAPEAAAETATTETGEPVSAAVETDAEAAAADDAMVADREEGGPALTDEDGPTGVVADRLETSALDETADAREAESDEAESDLAESDLAESDLAESDLAESDEAVFAVSDDEFSDDVVAVEPERTGEDAVAEAGSEEEA